ncbi:MAG: acetyl-CoA carboxylase biotin carboxylase subunit [Bradymonadia bacterium]
MSLYRPFESLLVANRGEIACRVLRTAKSMGLRTVAVFSEADADAPHVALADRAVCIGPAPVGASYLNVEAILDAARRSGAEAIHPGYGFLSENADFAEACAEAGLVFVGPPAGAIRAMGLKGPAKTRMIAAGVPCVPGYEGGEQDLDALAEHALEVGFPLMIKASAGGGGRGMRRLEGPEDLADALKSARSEAENAFSDGALILERAVDGARHIEVQIFADTQGQAVHLFERDCSVQRRHQKVVEEAPSPAVSEDLRARMGAAAVAAAEAIGYVGAGTVECLLAPSGEFYFLEMNTRLQVEHPVTEAITGLDLVAWQLAVAAGEPLPLSQDEITRSGHAIEVRLYAEDPVKFTPQTGRITRWCPPVGPGVRVDSGIIEGQSVTPHYDPMIAKIITHGATRTEARRRMLRALEATTLHGLITNQGFLHQIMAHPAFVAGEANTGFIGEHLPEEARGVAPSAEARALAAALLSGARPEVDHWRSGGPSRKPVKLLAEGADTPTLCAVEIVEPAPLTVRVTEGGEATTLVLQPAQASELRYAVDGVYRKGACTLVEGELSLTLDGFTTRWSLAPVGGQGASGKAGNHVTAPMAGAIIEVRAEVGQKVTAGDLLVILEAMKMQHELLAPADGVVQEITARPGDQVSPRQVLVVLELDSSD